MMGLVLQNGEVVYTKVCDNDSDDDGILDADELGISVTVGHGQNAIISNLSCENVCGEKYYTAKIKFYVFDYYDWEFRLKK